MYIRIMIGFLMLAATTGMIAEAGRETVPGVDEEPAPKAAWEAWRAEFEDGYSKARLAVLKINDSVFLKPGRTAYLLGRAGTPSSFRWSLEASHAAVLEVTLRAAPDESLRAELVHGGTRIDALEVLKAQQAYPVTDQIDVTGRIVGEGTDRPRLELKVFNQKHPAARNFEGLDFFAWDAAYRIEAKYVPAERPVAVILDTERGLSKRFFRHGHARFRLNGKTVRMPLYTQSAESDRITYLFAPFTDGTTGNETYGVGRYLDISISGSYPPETVLIDFNRAYNPLCARSEHFNCPLVDFHVPAAIRAGERYGKR